ncbi:MAG: hypothetical protein WCV50_03085 [Patescibacteria group bacterium]|jgi:hypothetical protein
MEKKERRLTQLQIWFKLDDIDSFFHQLRSRAGCQWLRVSHHGSDFLIKQEVERARIVYSELIAELGERFGVIPPPATQEIADYQGMHKAPAGRIYYREWYERMRAKYYEEIYRQLICSACPFSTGIGAFTEDNRYPCRKAPEEGMLMVTDLHICGMVVRKRYGKGDVGWTEQEWYDAILQEYESTRLRQVKAKQKRLIKAAETSQE